MREKGEPTRPDLIVVRTPLLPAEGIESWSEGLLAPRLAPDDPGLEEAVAHDRALLRRRLRALAARPEVLEALFLASPDLVEGLRHWERDPESAKGRHAEQSLVRYFLRMSSRPTPFGLFSGSTPGAAGKRTRLALPERRRYRRHSRLGVDYLFQLCEGLARDPGLRAELVFRPNSSLYKTGDRLRYVESRPYRRVRRYHLVAIESFDALEDTLRRAANGARLGDLAEALVAGDPDGEITLEDATSFLHELVDNQVLVPDLAPPVTGEDGVRGALQQLDGLSGAGEARERLSRAGRALAQLDSEGLGVPLDRYRGIARELGVETSRFLQVDLMKPAPEVTLGQDVIDEILGGVDVLNRMLPAQRDTALETFRKAFLDRYGDGREVPLLEALDEEIGIGFDRLTKASADASPLLAELKFRPRDRPTPVAWTRREDALLTLLSDTLARGRMESALTAEHVRRLAEGERRPLPHAFHVSVALAAGSAEAVDRGERLILLDHAAGPSGARLLGRFCHLDERILEGVRAHLRAEESQDPEAVYAEIVHLPAGRIGNIVARPVLRGHEIPFLGWSGAPREGQIPVQDLTVTVVGDRVRLRSRSLGRQVVPRLTAAHFTGKEGLGVYRLAGALQGQGRASLVQWSWWPFEKAAFLPRVVLGRLVLARARWRVLKPEIAPLAAAKGAARYRLAQKFREERRLPRLVYQVEDTHELLLDLQNPLSLDALIDRIKDRDELVLTEVFPAPDDLGAVEGPEGRFFHEILILCSREAEPLSAPRSSAPAVRIARSFPPGSEWLYARIYTGTGTADPVLLGEIAPLVREAPRWFFLRSSDPDWHLRVYVQGDPSRLQEAFRRLLESGQAWRVQLDTYEREVERFGGDEGIELSEEIFFRDSEAAVDQLGSLAGDADLRWRILLAGLDRLLEDFGYCIEARLELVEREHARLASPYEYEILRAPLKSRLRRDRAELERLLISPEESFAVLDQRSEAIAGIVHRLQDLERQGQLSRPLGDIVPLYLHQSANRFSRSAGEEHEIVIYDYLARIYRSLLARGYSSTRRST